MPPLGIGFDSGCCELGWVSDPISVLESNDQAHDQSVQIEG